MSNESTPICRCRVLWLGSAVPQASKDGLQGVQEPLRELYPEQGAAGARGLDSWLSVWSNGILLENVDENHKKVTRFFPIESLHYCAAVRYVLVPEKNTLHSPTPRFLPLDSPFARAPNPLHPPLFAAILRRTTGIKVLECHAFICKREMAANALVRCCFHAYADSSYAKHIETGGSAITNGGGGNSHSGGASIYGTLGSRNNLQKIDHDEWKNANSKVEGWKLSRSNAGSTMTINSVGKTDDISIYNGDENHKVWAGSQDNLDSVYDIYSTSTISRPTRPRQIAQPVEVPPPPKEKGKKRNKKLLGGSKDELYHPLLNGKSKSEINLSTRPSKASSVAGGTMMKPRPMSTLMRPPQGPPGPGMHPHQPVYIIQPHIHPSTTLPNPKIFKHGTFSHRNKKMLIPARPIPPPFVPMAAAPPIIIPNPATLQKSKKKHKYHNHVMEEPIYMPSNRALSPVASYQPINFPHEAYLMQQYATMDPKYSTGTKKKDKNGSIPVAIPAPILHSAASSQKLNKKLAQSMNGLDDPNLAPEESPFNTGIYRKKGHLNERAFSYSIRQEHRSRSYGSLANLKFATPVPNGVNEVEDREDIKKEREIIQMVRDLDLSGDELERIEVPRGMYDPSTGGSPSSNHNNTSSSHHHNGHNGHPSTNSGVLHRPMSHMQIPTAVMTNGRAHRR
ncbi:uncharacterized protein LOC123300511 [Chrysoperla carnea]|uniref:uncharacterized protein LOC123300511 n=1 Tax=Chrysoperla carnea TaxID=189513 RepID=UPI001D081258|nr:uncharacterized protein LOC123300511 [Chrysoperla carnea]